VSAAHSSEESIKEVIMCCLGRCFGCARK
jgi:hypothetical protein